MAAAASKASEENYYNSNDSNVSNYDLKNIKYGSITKLSTGEQIEDYLFRIFVKDYTDIPYFVSSSFGLPYIDIAYLPDVKENYNNILATVETLFDQKKLCVGLAKEYVKRMLSPESKNTMFLFVKKETKEVEERGKILDLYDFNDEGNIFGFAAFYFNNDAIHLSLVCTNKDYKGVGSAIMKKIHEVGRKNDAIKYVYLESVESAVGFYKKKKYKPLKTKFKLEDTPMIRKLKKTGKSTVKKSNRSPSKNKSVKSAGKPAGGKSASKDAASEPAGKPAGGAGAK